MNRLLIIIMSLSLSACILPKAVSDKNSEVDFSKYKTFRFCPNFPKIENSTDAKIEAEKLVWIRSQIIENMKLEGFSADDANPQVEVGFEIYAGAKEETVMNCRMENNSDYWPTCKYETYEFSEGELIIHLTDLEKNQIVWQGSIAGEVESIEKVKQKRLNQIVDRIFEEFPN